MNLKLCMIFAILWGFVTCELSAKEKQELINEIYDKTWMAGLDPEIYRENGAKLVYQFMNTSADPCEDFYNFACGNFANLGEEIPDTYTFLTKKIKAAVKEILLDEENDSHYNPEDSYFRSDDELKKGYSEAEISAKNFYKSCVDTETRKKRGVRPLIEFYENFKKQFELENTHDWINLTAFLSIIGEDVFIHESVYSSDDEDSGRQFYLRPGKPLFFQSGFFEKDLLAKIQSIAKKIKQVEEILKIFGWPDTENTTAEIFEFDFKFSEIVLKNYTKKFKTIKELQEITPAIDWIKYLSIVAKEEDIDENYKVYVSYENAFEKLNELLEKTSNETIWKYSMFRMFFYLYQLTSVKYTGKYEWIKNLDEFCSFLVESLYQPTISAMFLRKYVSRSVEEDVLRMINETDQNFISFIENDSSLNENAKRLSIAKTLDTSSVIGVKDRDALAKSLKENYVGIEMDPEKFFENMIKITQHLHDIKHKNLSADFIQDDATTVNAMYQPEKSRRVFWTGFLVPPSYHIHYPKWINYGNLAATLGHELIHAFDIRGFLYKANQTDLQQFDLSTVSNYFGQSICLARQYNSYTFENISKHVDGVKTIGDNIADLGGLIIAFNAYKDWLEQHPDLTQFETIPDLDLTPTQLFFVGNAQTFCDEGKPYMTGYHTPDRIRAYAPFINMQQFQEEYKCPAGSAMNPKKRCNFL